MKHIVLILFCIIFYSCKKGDSQEDKCLISTKNLLEEYKHNFGEMIFSKSINQKYDSLLFEKSGYKISFISYSDYFDTLHTNTFFQVIVNKNKKLIKSNLFSTNKQFLTANNFDFDIYNDILFITWVSTYEKNDHHYEKIFLKCIDLKKRNVLIYKEFQVPDAALVNNISIIYNHLNNNILFAFNDYSAPSSRDLILGNISFNGSKIGNTINFQSILQEDEYQKRNPYFIRNKENIYLLNTTGDNWGFFEHTGIQKMSISTIDNANNVNRIGNIFDRLLPINEDIIIQSDTIFYRIEKGNDYKDFISKKVAISDLKTPR